MDAHFNNLTPAQAERLTVLAEECAEVIQAIMKIQRHGLESRFKPEDPSNLEHLEEEVGHARCAINRCVAAGDFDRQALCMHEDRKLRTAARYFHHNDA